jgi:hypothetical protein
MLSNKQAMEVRCTLFVDNISIELPMIEEQDRKLEKEVLDQFNTKKPDIMTFLFDTLAKAMTLYPIIRTSGLPRMATYAMV